MTDPVQSPPPSHLRGYVFALLATAFWSGNFIMARGLNQDIPPITLAFCRWATAVVFFLPFALKTVVRERRAIFAHLPYLSLVSFIGVSCFNTFIYIAGHTTTAMNLALISITFPVFILLISRVAFGHGLGIRKLAGVALVLVGVVALISKGEVARLVKIQFTIGDIWVLAAAVLFAVYSILLKQKPKELGLVSVQFSTFFLGLTFLFPFFIWEQWGQNRSFFTPKVMGAVLYVGIFASLFAFVCWNKAVEIAGPARAGMVYYLLPMFCGGLGHVFLGEPVGRLHLFSLCVIVSGILLTNSGTGKRRVKTMEPKEENG